jgi:hypothetical protein
MDWVADRAVLKAGYCALRAEGEAVDGTATGLCLHVAWFENNEMGSEGTGFWRRMILMRHEYKSQLLSPPNFVVAVLEV